MGGQKGHPYACDDGLGMVTPELKGYKGFHFRQMKSPTSAIIEYLRARGITTACTRPPTRWILCSCNRSGRRVMPGVMRLPMSANRIPEMRNIFKVFLTVGLLFVCCSDCFPQRRDVPGWQDARWGMSEAELLGVFNSRLKKLPKREEFLA
jgi:hypothetical protein